MQLSTTTQLLLSEHVWLPTVTMLLVAVHVFMQWRQGTARLRRTPSAETKDPKDLEDREGAEADSLPQPPWKRGFFGLWPGSGYAVFESAKTPEQLKADLRAMLGPVWDVFTPGCKGWVLGPCVRVGWLPKWSSYWQRSHLAFRGWLVKAADGSGGCSLRGYIRMHFLLEAFVFLMRFMFVGTFLMWAGTDFHPRYGVGFLGVVVFNGLSLWAIHIGAKAAVREIHRHLTQVCHDGNTPIEKNRGGRE